MAFACNERMAMERCAGHDSAEALDDNAPGFAVVLAFILGRENKHRTLGSAEALDDDAPGVAASHWTLDSAGGVGTSRWTLDSAGALDDDAPGFAVVLAFFLGCNWSWTRGAGAFAF